MTLQYVMRDPPTVKEELEKFRAIRQQWQALYEDCRDKNTSEALRRYHMQRDYDQRCKVLEWVLGSRGTAF